MNLNIPKVAIILSLSLCLAMIGQTADAKTSFTPLKTGMRSAKVLEVEKMLSALKFNQQLKVDKLYNKYTTNNVKKFQKANKLKQTGVVNEKTYLLIKKKYSLCHRANILHPSFGYIAVAAVDGGPYGKTFVQMFVEK